MKIAFITTYGVKCGIATYTEHLARGLSIEHDVTIFAEDNLGNTQPDFKTNLKLFRCFNRNSPDTRLLRALDLYSPDVIHIQHEYGIFKNLKDVLTRIRAQYKGRTIMTLHTVKTNHKFDLHGCADYFIVHKEHARMHLVGDCEIEHDRIKVIPHGTLIIPQISSRAARLRLGLPLDSIIILSHSFFERRKNIDKIIKVIAELKNEFPLYYIHLGGLHPHVKPENGQLYLQDYLKLIKELDVSSKVKLVNRFIPEEELVYFLNASDIIVTLENSCYPNISASGIMHTVAGKPVIASNVINFAEFPEGSFYKVKIEEDSLKQAIRDILLNSELSDGLLRNLLKYAKETSWDKIAEKHLKLYERCVSTIRYVYA
ncbi:MAG TPA: glycosyltransferase [Archaeoglobaceae archaeon]|nr:glycosyltransferase [Archaeoglobaceae archaeon]